jgi:CPA1 family monovalent cation:H+ antiporter
MRGGDSLVIALAIPYTVASGAPFPGRPLVIFVTFGVILATLVVQGLTLTPIVRWLGLHDTNGDENDALGEAIARRAMADTALRHIAHVAAHAPPEDRRMLERTRTLYTLRRDRWHAEEDAEVHRHSAKALAREAAWDRTASAHAKLQREIIDAERRTLGLLRTDDRVSEDVLQRLERELDLEYLLSESSEAGDDGLGESPYEVGDVGDVDVE